MILYTNDDSPKKVFLKESQLFMLNEISSIANNTDVTVCSIEDFSNICRNFQLDNGSTATLTDQNVESLYGKYAFIEIRDSRANVDVQFPLTKYYKGGDVQQETEEYFNKLFYFKEDHKNVIRVEYEDSQSVGKGKKGEGMTVGPISLDRINDRYKFNQKGEPRRKTMFYSYPNGIDFNDEIAEKINNFVNENISVNPMVKFIIHCRAGASRSAGIGTFIANIKQEIYNDKEYVQKFFKEHVKDDGSPQFDIGVDKKGTIKLPHQKEMKKLGALRGWNKENDDSYLQWYMNHFLDSGLFGDKTNDLRARQAERINKKNGVK
jgi:hypothetical protein